MKSKFFIISMAILLSACAIGKDGQLAGAGDANYTYKHTARDGSSCEVTILSGRDVQGAKLQIDKDCALTSGADNTRGAEAALKVIDNGITLGRELASKVP
jgi:hypothetical protein